MSFSETSAPALGVLQNSSRNQRTKFYTKRWAMAAKLSHPSILLTKSPSLSPLSLSPCKSLLVEERKMSALPTYLQLFSLADKEQRTFYAVNKHTE